MKVEFLEKFSRDLENIRLPFVKKAVERAILEAEAAKTLQEIRNVKKLKGSKTAYRIRIGDYRIGFYFENGAVQFARVCQQKGHLQNIPLTFYHFPPYALTCLPAGRAPA